MSPYGFWKILLLVLCICNLSECSPKTAENVSSEDEKESDLKSYRHAFFLKRRDQKGVVRQLQELGQTNLKKQETSLKLAYDAVFKTLGKAQAHLIDSSYQVGEWPQDESVKSSLSTVLENTALFSELLLYFPDFVHESLKKDPKRDQLIKWCLTMSNVDKFFFTVQDRERFNLTLQELDLMPKSDEYTNPYSKEAKVEALKAKLEQRKDISKDKESLKKKKRDFSSKKGPRLRSAKNANEL